MNRTQDVLDLLARSRPARLDPPPDRAEHKVSAIVADESVTVTHARPRHRRTRMAVLASAGVSAAVIAGAIVAAAVAPRHTPPGGASGDGTAAAPATVPGDAGPLLLAAAERSAVVPSAGGRYLTLQTEYGVALPVEAASGRYTMIQKGLSQYWLARPGAGTSWVTVQSLGATPATPADEAAWRRAGSPAVVRATLPKPADVAVAPGKVRGNTVDADRVFGLGDRSVSLAQLDALPTDPAALRDELLSRFDGGGGDMPTDRNQWLLGVVASVVMDLPVTGQVRAAAFRLLAQLPGVRALGAVQDVRGRAGQAVAFSQDSPAIGGFEVRLIIDTETGQALARETRAVRPGGTWSWIEPGALVTYQVVLVSTRTDDSPPVVETRD